MSIVAIHLGRGCAEVGRTKGWFSLLGGGSPSRQWATAGGNSTSRHRSIAETLSPQISARNYTKFAQFKEKLAEIPSLSEFLQQEEQGEMGVTTGDTMQTRHGSLNWIEGEKEEDGLVESRKVFIESYGCQMNFADSDIVYSIMKTAGYDPTTDWTVADIIFLNTCAIREKAELKIWQRLTELKQLKLKRRKIKPLTVGVLGCMAERLKEKLLEKDKMVDLVVGPDAYRDLPNLLIHLSTAPYSQAINVALSLEETYADISPIRVSSNGVSAYVSIMRGCNNMCSYCIVPFTRGRERSRALGSILKEVEELRVLGVKEIVLLGQNVNSYNDMSEVDLKGDRNGEKMKIVEGFETVYQRPQAGISFAMLVEEVSKIDEEIRIRFTSPHPKDFPDELLYLLRNSVNVCKSIHIPAQSGSSSTLARMRRGYTRNAYLNLINKIRSIIPDITLSSDFISGFCGETEEEHQETLSLLEEVGFDAAFMFAYSMREKTPATRKFADDVPEDVKKRRLQEVIDKFHQIAFQKYTQEVGKIHLVLVESRSRRSASDWKGRSDNNRKVVFPDLPINDLKGQLSLFLNDKGDIPTTSRSPEPGDYVIVNIVQSTGLTLKGQPLAITTQGEFWRLVNANNLTAIDFGQESNRRGPKTIITSDILPEL